MDDDTKIRTTLSLEKEQLERAQRLTGIQERPALIRAALQALIEREAARRLAKLGGTEDELTPIPRRRMTLPAE